MTKSKDLRNVAITHYQNGRNASEISTTLANKVHHVTIHRGIQRFNQSGLVNAHELPLKVQENVREPWRWISKPVNQTS
ncbi:unnamed protein product [Rotaria magnacalcarata]|uniref:Uncharacterized protein n=1 Tax=Rotaria magnacalcarata TaxID=392030 RepID=A0A820WT53_9BILA|nr:unnamed protein product [Rotaria magnacalcarata]CAF4521535.1 unnamed protein product [Rotaria magnacalcarata]